MNANEAGAVALIADVASVLHSNGQETEETIRAVGRLGGRLGSPLWVSPNWGLLFLGREDGSDQTPPSRMMAVTPDAVAINRVVATSLAVEAVIDGRIGIAEAARDVAAAQTLPPYSDTVFAAACAAGAAALSITFGVEHILSVVLIFVSAGAGGYLRRFIGRRGGNGFAQAFAAALLAGIIGAIAVRADLSSELRLIAVCPCMVLVPGPFLLNGALDLLGNRMPIGMSRLAFAATLLTAISAGLLTGLIVCGVDLPPAPAGRDVALWSIVLAAGAAAACYSIFFSMPLRLLGWPIITAIAADAARWLVMGQFGVGPIVGAGVAGLVAGLILTPVARRYHIPFAGIGFASVVSLMPGVFVFRMFAGILALQHATPADMLPLLEGTVTDGLTAILVIATMTVAIVVPKHAYDAYQKWDNARSAG